jgi:glycine/D-amino acid oxidase-like deaminating enzyme
LSDEILADGFSEEPWWWQHAAPGDHGAGNDGGECDVLVVGSGYAGLSCAHELASSGLSVAVLDAGRIGSGASTRAAGLLSGRAGVSKQIDLEALAGREHAARIFDEADEAYAYLRRLVADNDIHCHLEACGRFVGAHTPAAYDKLAAKAREYDRGGGARFRMVPKSEQGDFVDSDYWYGGMYTEDAGSIHPSLYHRGLVDLCIGAGVTLVSNNRVLGIVHEDGFKCVATERGTWRAREVVLATNGYTDALSPWHRKRLIPISSTVAASEPIGADAVAAILPKRCPVIDTRRVICYLRPAPDGESILFGGRARFSPLGPAESAKILRAQLVEMFPRMSYIKVTHAWSGLMGFTFDFMPKIGIHQGLHYAVGCNGGCGIVMMSWLGRRIAGKLLGSATRPSAFEGLEFKTQPFYSGKPWFLPVIGNWWRLRDWLEIRRARASKPRGTAAA